MTRRVKETVCKSFEPVVVEMFYGIVEKEKGSFSEINWGKKWDLTHARFDSSFH